MTRARAAADDIADDIQRHIDEHTTDSTERATLRLMGVAGVNDIDVPLVNVVIEQARELLPGGIVLPFVDLMLSTGHDAQTVAEGVAAGELPLEAVPAERRAAAELRGAELAVRGRRPHRRRAPAPRRARRPGRRARSSPTST